MTIHQDTNRPPIYEHDGKVYYRASAMGGCINELILFRKGELGEDKTMYIEKVLEAGHEHEPAVRDYVAQEANVEILLESEPVQLEVVPGHVIVGNTDGRVRGEDGDFGAEIKTLGPDSFKNFIRSGLDKFPEYQWQLSIYMYATEMPWLYAAAERSREEVDGEYEFYVDPETTKILPIIYDPPITLAKIRRKVRRIEALAQVPLEELPQCEKAKFCSMVRFHDLIGGNIEAEESEKIGLNDPLHDLLMRRQQLKDHATMLEKERKELDKEILSKHMEGPAYIEGKGRWVPVLQAGREKLDKDQLRIDLGDEFDKYVSQGNPYSYLRFYEDKEE